MNLHNKTLVWLSVKVLWIGASYISDATSSWHIHSGQRKERQNVFHILGFTSIIKAKKMSKYVYRWGVVWERNSLLWIRGNMNQYKMEGKRVNGWEEIKRKKDLVWSLVQSQRWHAFVCFLLEILCLNWTASLARAFRDVLFVCFERGQDDVHLKQNTL